MKSWKAMVAALGTAAMVLGTATVAAADPTNAKKGEILQISCDAGLGDLTVALNGNSRLAVGHPYAIHIVGSFTPTGGDPQPIAEDAQKNAPKNGRLAVCTFHEEGSDEFGSFVIDGTVWISYTPA